MKKLFIIPTLLIFMVSCGEDKDNTNTAKTKNTDVVEADSTDSIASNDSVVVVMNEGQDEPQIIKDDTKGTASSDNVESKTYDLSEHGLAVTIELPRGVKIIVTELDEIELSFGDDFIMTIGESFFDSPSQKKSGIKNTVHNEVLGYLKEEADGYIVRVKSNGIETHNLFYMITVGDIKYQIENSKGKGYSKAEILAMHKAVKSIKVKAGA